MHPVDERCRIAEKLIREQRQAIESEQASLEKIMKQVFPGIAHQTGWGGIDSRWSWDGWLITIAEDALLLLGDEDATRIMVNAER